MTKAPITREQAMIEKAKAEAAFKPWTDKECMFEVTKAEKRTSHKTPEPMDYYVLWGTLTNESNGATKETVTTLMTDGGAAFKYLDACDAMGLTELHSVGALEEYHFVRKFCKVSIGVKKGDPKKDAEGKATGEFYPEKNEITGFIVGGLDAPATAAFIASQKTSAEVTEDEIPF